MNEFYQMHGNFYLIKGVHRISFKYPTSQNNLIGITYCVFST